ISKGDGLVVTAERDIKDRLEHRAFGGEQPVQGRQRGAGGGGDRFESGRGIAMLDEQGSGCLDDLQPGCPDLGLAAGVVVGPLLDGASHIRDSTTIMARVGLSQNCRVLVVGAGPGGLVAAITLARYGIDVLLIDKRSTPSGLSRSLVVSTRGMELMRRFGLEEAVRSGAADVKIGAWVTPDLASGQGTEMPLGSPSDAEAALASPTRPAWVAQDHHEPIMFEHLRSLPSASIRLGCQLRGVTQDDHGVRATVADAGTGTVEDLGASFLIAADGAHSTVREQLGITMVGPDNLADYERVEFTAPLWQLAGEYRYGLYVITRPDV